MAFNFTDAGGQTAPIPVPSATAVATTANYVSTTDLRKADVGEQLIKRYGSQGLTGLLDFVGAKKATGNCQYSHFEERFIHDSFTATIAVTTGVMTIDGSAKAPLRVGDILLSETEVTYIVVSGASADGATLLRVDGVAVAAEVSKKMSIVGNAHAEGTGQPIGLTPEVDKYENNTQIIKEAYDVTGSGATDVAWFKVDGGFLWYLKGEADASARFENYAELQMLLGAGNASTVVQIGGKDVNITRGLLPDIQDGGNVMVGSGFDIGSADTMIKQLDKQRGAKENAFMCGIDLALDIDDFLAAQGGGSTLGIAASFGAFQNSKEMAVNLGFGAFSRGGYTFHKKTYDVFNHPMLLGAVSYASKGIVIPMDKQKDAKSGAMVPSLQIRFKAAGGYSREMEHWLTGSAVLGTPTSDVDELKCNYRCEKGFEGFAMNRFVLID